jgi:hypothetical protein
MAASLSVYWNHFGAWAYLPGIAALARSGFRSRGATLGFGALVGLQAMAGSPEVSAATVVLAGALVWSPRAEFPEPFSLQPRAVRLRRYAAGVGLGLALAAWVIVPMAELAAHSERRHAFSAEERDAGAVGWRDAGTMSGFTPASFGGSYLATLFLPPFVLVAAAAAFQEDHRRRLALLLALFAALGLLLAAAGPPGAWLRSLAPLDRVRTRRSGSRGARSASQCWPGSTWTPCAFHPQLQPRAAVAAAEAGAAALSPLPPQVRLCCCVAAALGLALGLGRRPPRVPCSARRPPRACRGLRWRWTVAAFAQAQVTLPRIRAPLSRVPGRVITPPMGALWGWVLRDGSFDGAMLARQREALLGYTNLPCRVPTVRTAAPLPTAAAAAIAAAIGPAEDALPAGAAGARVLWTPFAPARLPSKRIGDFYRAPLAPYLPRLAFVRGYRVEPDAERAWARVASGEVDLTREVLLDRRPVPDPAGPGEHPMLLARLVEDAPERVVAELTASFPGVLVLADLDYPGWVAEEGGRRLPILKANGYFRAVALPAGVHRVEFRYRPMSFYAGAGISVIALLVALGLWHAGEPVLTRRRA